MIYIFNRNDKLLKILTEYENFEYIEKLNNQDEVSLDSNETEYLIKDHKLGFFNKNGEFKLFLIDDVKEFKDEYSTTITLNCINDIYVLNNKIIEDKRVVNGPVSIALEKALEGTEYQVGLIEQFENKDINFYFISSMKALNNIITTYGCEFTTRIIINPTTGEISNKYIDIKHRIGEETGLRFTYDTNLTSIEKTPVSEVFNVLYGQGKSLETENGGYSRKLNFSSVNNGLKYIEDVESIKKYGRKEGIFENNNIDDPNTLLVKTREKLNEVKNRKYSYEVNVEDLSNFKDFEHYKYNIGDSIIIMDEEDNISLTARIIAINTTEDTTTLTLGYFQNGLFDEDIEDSISDLKDKVNNILNNNDNNIDDNKYPDTLPNIPVVEAQGLFSSVVLTWTYENKSYYTYEVFASKIKDFNPSTANRIFEGKASSFLHEVKPDETWYYRVRAKNTHDKFTSYSAQVKATTKKISDGTQYFEELAIGHALIASLDLDKATVGKLKAQFLDVYNLLVTDGNGKKTLEIDSFGNVNLDVNELNIRGKSITSTVKEDISKTVYENLIKAGNFRNRNIVTNFWQKDNELDWYLNGYTIGLTNKTNNEFFIYSNRINMSELVTRTISFSCSMLAEHRIKGADVFLIGSESTVMNYDWVLQVANYKSGEEAEYIYENIEIPRSIKYLWVRVDHNGVNGNLGDTSYVVLYIDYINLVPGSMAIKGIIPDKSDLDNLSHNYESFKEQTAREFSQKVSQSDFNNLKENHTSFKQTSEKFQYEIEKRSTANILKNSRFSSNRSLTENWTAHRANVINNNVPSLVAYDYGWEWAYKDAEVNTLVISDKNSWMMLGGELGANQSVNLIKGKEYTLSFYCAAHRVNECYATIRGTAVDTWDWVAHKGFTPREGGINLGNWSYITLTFIAERTDTIIEIGIKGTTGEDPYMFIAKPMLNIGAIAAPFTSNNDEISKGITTVDDKGITVKHSSGSSASFNHDGSIWRDNLGREGIKINNGGIAFIDVENGEWTNFMRTSYKSDGSGMNGLTISTSNVGDFIGIGCSNVSDINGNWYSSSALTIENYDGKHGLAGLHFWSMANMNRNESHLHNHTNYIQESGHIYMNDRTIVFDGFGSETPNWIGCSASDRGRLCIFSDNVLALGYRIGEQSYGALEIHESDGFHSYRNWDFNNWTMYNMRTTYSISNSRTRKYTEAHGLKSDEDSIRYVYKKMQFKNNKLILSIPNAYVGCNYTILNIVKYGKGDVWISEENENGFILESDNDIKVNIEIDITNIENVSNFERKISRNDYSRNTDDKLKSVETTTENTIPYWKLYVDDMIKKINSNLKKIRVF